MEISHQDDGKQGSFVATAEGNMIGKIVYTWAGTNKIIIDHTEVNSEYNGKGIGVRLIMKVVDLARENEISIMPLCPFARRVFERNKAIQDVLF